MLKWFQFCKKNIFLRHVNENEIFGDNIYAGFNGFKLV